ncbi:DUF5333 family protein [Actibacterium ureilyticum]|uniref:DUF5333 family protein n=1 Tax=Actibacterium ureilyticum TaxID=1590614 RepID=UPI001140E8CB|nr:DUF5333 family protein [Actibacterium ureilyticum]
MSMFARVMTGCVLLAALAACQTSTADRPVETSRAPYREMPEEMYRLAFDAATANVIARNCSNLSTANPVVNKDRVALFRKLDAQGYEDRDFDAMQANLPKKRMQSEVFAYIQKMGIIVDEPATYCGAGYAEIRQGTRVGRYLRKRG